MDQATECRHAYARGGQKRSGAAAIAFAEARHAKVSDIAHPCGKRGRRIAFFPDGSTVEINLNNGSICNALPADLETV